MAAVAVRADLSLVEFLADKGDLTKAYAVACAVYWLTVLRGRAVVATGDVRTAYPHRPPPNAPRLAAVTDDLRRAVEQCLLERVTILDVGAAPGPDGGAGWLPGERTGFRLTPCGRAVVEALPDLDRVGVIRGMSRSAPGGVRARSATAEPGVSGRRNRPTTDGDGELSQLGG